jgi:hypothetical protein
MPSINDLKSSKFLKKDDVGAGKLVTIASVHQENVAKDGADPEMKWCLSFNELDKPMVLNSTNAQVIGKITGIEDNIEIGWVGRQIVIYDDPNVSYAGKITGGIRCRAPKTVAVPDLPF